MREERIAFENVLSDMIFRSKCKRQKLLYGSDIQFLQDIAVARDEVNNGITQQEMITIIQELSSKDRVAKIVGIILTEQR